MDEASTVFDLIYPIRISTPFALGDVWSYLIKDEKIVLVDCGHKSENAYACIRERFDEAGLSVKDLDEIWLTHGHPDHFGQAARLADESGAVICGHKKERANFEGNSDGSLFKTFFSEQGIPAEHIEIMTEQLSWLQQFQEPVQPEWIEEGQVMTSGRLLYTVRHAPGHAPGHVVFHSDQGVVFGGDVLLGHISTNALINFDPDTGERNHSLLQYRDSLKWIRTLEGTVLPGHGEQVSRIRETADHHLNDQRQRYAAIRKLLMEAKHGYSLYELTLKTFPEAMKKGTLFLVLSEVLGYLDWGMEDDIIEAVRFRHGMRYRLTEDTLEK